MPSTVAHSFGGPMAVPVKQAFATVQPVAQYVKWDPSEVLQVVNRDYGGITCVGYAPSAGRRCRNPINQGNRAFMQQLLREMENSQPDPYALKNLLHKLAGATLCLRYHQGQQDEMVRQWQGKIQQFAFSKPVKVEPNTAAGMAALSEIDLEGICLRIDQLARNKDSAELVRKVERDTLISSNLALEKAKTELTQKSKAAVAERDDLRAKNATLAVEVQCHKETAALEKLGIEADVKKARAQRDKARTERDQAQARLAQQDADVKAAASRSAQLDAETARLTAEDARVKSDKARVKIETQKIKTEAQQVKADKAHVRTEVERVSADKAHIKAEAERVKIEKAKVKAEAERVAAEVARAHEQCAALQREAAETRAAAERALQQQQAEFAELLRSAGLQTESWRGETLGLAKKIFSLRDMKFRRVVPAKAVEGVPVCTGRVPSVKVEDALKVEDGVMIKLEDARVKLEDEDVRAITGRRRSPRTDTEEPRPVRRSLTDMRRALTAAC